MLDQVKDNTVKFVLVWIAVMLTILAVDKLFQPNILFAQDGSGLESGEPIEVIIREPIKVNVINWNAYPSQPIKVKIDDPWPARIEIKDQVEVKGELKLKK